MRTYRSVFHCIAVDMDAVDDCGLIPETQEMPTYLHELSRPFTGSMKPALRSSRRSRSRCSGTPRRGTVFF